MKQHVLVLATLLSVGLTGAMFLSAQGSPIPARRADSPRHRETSGVTKSDPSFELAARRCFRGEPRHWRDCLVQR
jgi:hypothetical protein